MRRSPSSGSRIALAWCAPSRQMESETPHSLKPEQKFSVPSIGSSTAVQPAAVSAASPSAPGV